MENTEEKKEVSLDEIPNAPVSEGGRRRTQKRSSKRSQRRSSQRKGGKRQQNGGKESILVGVLDTVKRTGEEAVSGVQDFVQTATPKGGKRRQRKQQQQQGGAAVDAGASVYQAGALPGTSSQVLQVFGGIGEQTGSAGPTSGMIQAHSAAPVEPQKGGQRSQRKADKRRSQRKSQRKQQK